LNDKNINNKKKIKKKPMLKIEVKKKSKKKTKEKCQAGEPSWSKA